MTELLEDMINRYGVAKNTLDEQKELVDTLNKTIKSAMENRGIDEFTTDKYKAKYIIQHRETLNEAKLLNMLITNPAYEPILTKYSVIKTKQYIDMDAFENALYHDEFGSDDKLKFAECTTSKDVATLKVTKVKR